MKKDIFIPTEKEQKVAIDTWQVKMIDLKIVLAFLTLS